MKLTQPQKRQLIRIVAAFDEKPGREPLPAGWFGSRAEKSLVEKGLVREWTEKRPLGGGGAIGYMSMVWHFCEPTEEGWAMAAELLK